MFKLKRKHNRIEPPDAESISSTESKEKAGEAEQPPDPFAEMVVINRKKQRFWELDFLRGICVILMVFYHFFYSAVDILFYVQQWAGKEFWAGLMSFSKQFLVNRFISVAHYVVVGLFLFLCGISCTLTRNNAQRGFKTLGFALIITLVTWMADAFGLIPDIMISFGVIHMLACSMLLFSLVDLMGAGLQTLVNKLAKIITKKLAKRQSKRVLYTNNITESVSGVVDNAAETASAITNTAENASTVTNITMESTSAVTNSTTGSASAVTNSTTEISATENTTSATASSAEKNTAKIEKTAAVMLWVRRLLPAFVGILGIILFFTIPLGHFGSVTRTIVVGGKEVFFYPIRLLSDVAETNSRGLNNFLSMLINIDKYTFKSSDYFPIFPYAFVLLVGGTVGALVYKTRAKTALVRLDGRWNKPVCFVGRHAMLVYLAHQLVIVAFMFAAGGVVKLFG